LALTGGVVGQRDQINRAFSDQVFDNAQGVGEGDLEPRMDAVVNLKHIGHRLKRADDGGCVVKMANMPIGRGGVERECRIGRGHPRHSKAAVQIAQAQFHGHAHIGARLYLAFYHVAVHIHKAGQQQQALAR
jgi:hypothetical protein